MSSDDWPDPADLGENGRVRTSWLVQVARAAVVVLLDAVALFLLNWVLPGFELEDAGTAVAMAAVVGVLNGLVWPALARFALPLNVLSLGLFSLVLNGVLLTLASEVLPGARIDGWFEGVVVTIGLAAMTTAVSALLSIDDDESWHRNVVSRQARRRGTVEETDVPGVVFLEIDGLAHEVLRRAIRDGNAPTIGRWMRDGGHRLERWETDWSSQTGACQAGLLHGSNDDMPAFRWWEKDRGKPIVTNHPRDAEELERRHSNGRGLLHEDGASRANILSGDAVHSMLTMSTVLHRRRPIGRDYSAYFARPYAAVHTLVLALADIARERHAAVHQRRADIRPRGHRDRRYALVRAWGTVIQRDLQVAAVVGDMLAGRPVIYTTFLAYDEVAHHSGIERHDALTVLRQVDRQLARVEAAGADAPRPYRLVVLSDHGQSQGETFLQRYDVTLEQVVTEACEATDVHSDTDREDDGMSYISAGLTEVARDDTMTARVVRRARDGDEAEGEPPDELPELSVMASGCLGLVSFPREPGRVSRERLGALYPRLLPTLVEHPGVGFVLVHSEAEGALAIGKEGVHHLESGRVEGADPLEPFGPNAAAKVKRTSGFAHCPDLVVNSTYWDDMEEVAAFEELVGSHGGMGGPQSFPFVLFPAELSWPDEEPLGAEAVHRVFRTWLAGLGHGAYRDSEAPGSTVRTSTPGASAAT